MWFRHGWKVVVKYIQARMGLDKGRIRMADDSADTDGGLGDKGRIGE